MWLAAALVLGLIGVLVYLRADELAATSRHWGCVLPLAAFAGLDHCCFGGPQEPSLRQLSYRDRRAGQRVVDWCRGWRLGDPDRGRPSAPGWWHEVAHRIETSDVFVALTSASYASSQTCGLAAKHGDATLDLPVLRLDARCREPEGCHPVVPRRRPCRRPGDWIGARLRWRAGGRAGPDPPSGWRTRSIAAGRAGVVPRGSRRCCAGEGARGVAGADVGRAVRQSPCALWAPR